MRRMRLAAAGLVWMLGGLSAWAADDVRWVTRNGQTYREHVTVERVPTTVTRMEERQETVYTERYLTEVRDSQRTVYVPVTEYVMQPRWHGLWNPFTSPHVAYHMVPQTRWEVRSETVQVPVTTRELVPQTRTVQVPVRELGFEERQHITRVLVPGTRPSLAAEDIPAGGNVGVAKLENDPPKEAIQYRR